MLKSRDTEIKYTGNQAIFQVWGILEKGDQNYLLIVQQGPVLTSSTKGSYHNWTGVVLYRFWEI